MIKTEISDEERYRNWPRNIFMFYPEIAMRDACLSLPDAFRRQYPDVVSQYPQNVSIEELMKHIFTNRIEPQ